MCVFRSTKDTRCGVAVTAYHGGEQTSPPLRLPSSPNIGARQTTRAQGRPGPLGRELPALGVDVAQAQAQWEALWSGW